MDAIKNTDYSDNFDGPLGETVYQLSLSESAAIFDVAFGEEEKSFSSFSDDHWFVKADCQAVGRWIEAYNADENEPVSFVLKESMSWEEDMDIYFCVSRMIVLKTSWKNFVENWDSFLACEDDCPIVIQDVKKREALMFTSMGEIRQIKESVDTQSCR